MGTKRRVVVTGGGIVSPLGSDTEIIFNNLPEIRNQMVYVT